ncbi:Uncharacterised protein [Mycobacteroides abscessus subsp. abscessus]|nr:Uncharacterised protein [Mycobacteroides abscessus subsp. abscessus]
MRIKSKTEREPPRRDIGTSVYTGIAEDIPMPIIRSGHRNIEDVDDAPPAGNVRDSYDQ